MSAWRAYAETVFDLNAALEADLAPHGLTLGDYQVLVYLSEADDHSMRMCDLAARLQLSPSGLTRRLDGLVRAGLVERRPSDQDRRVMLAVLTDHGLRVPRARSRRRHVDSVRRHVIDRLERADVAAMARIFGAIRDGLHDDGRRRRMTRAARRASAATSPTSASRTTPTTSSSSPPTGRSPPPACSRAAGSPAERDDQPRAPRRPDGPRRSSIVSKNANVANGPAGRADAEAVVAAVAERLGCAPDDVLIASTGVIGRRYPLERILAGVAGDAGAAGRRRRPSGPPRGS